MTSSNKDDDKQILASELEQQLCQFTGTGAYYRLSRKHLMTDGAKYLADRAQCYWMMDAIVSHLCEIGTNDWFVHVHMTVTGQHALMVYDDGNGRELARQAIAYTDFPLSEITLYACWDSEHWVILLPSEY